MIEATISFDDTKADILFDPVFSKLESSVKATFPELRRKDWNNHTLKITSMGYVITNDHSLNKAVGRASQNLSFSVELIEYSTSPSTKKSHQAKGSNIESVFQHLNFNTPAKSLSTEAMKGPPRTSLGKLINRIERASAHGLKFLLYTRDPENPVTPVTTVDLTYNGDEGSRRKISEIFDQNFDSPFPDLPTFFVNGLCKDNALVQRTANALTEFSASSETTAQNSATVKSMYEELEFFDSHSNAVSYLEATDVSSPSKTAKPDGLHCSLPVILDWKGNDADSTEGLEQLLERMTTMATMQGFFSNIIGFASGEKSKVFWFCRFTHEINRDKATSQKTIHIWSLPIQEVAKVLVSVVQLPISMFLLKEAPYLLGCLEQLNIFYFECKISIKGISSSTAWEVSLPEDNQTRFLIKINFDEERFLKESKALAEIALNQPQTFYVYGAMVFNALPELSPGSFLVDINHQQFQVEKYRYFKEEQWPQLLHPSKFGLRSAEIPAANPWFSRRYKLNSKFTKFPFRKPRDGIFSGGLIVMEVGEAIDIANFEPAEIEKLVYDINGSLQLIHKAGVLHADLRMMNILRFNHRDGTYRYDLIDFDLSCSKADPHIRIFPGTSQAKRAPMNVRSQLTSNEESTVVKWCEAYDYCMFYDYLLTTFKVLPSNRK